MDTHSSILAWRIPWTQQPGRLQPVGLQSDPTERYHFHVLVITLSILMSSLGSHATLPGWWSGYPTSTLRTKLRTHFLAWLFGPWWEIVF